MEEAIDYVDDAPIPTYTWVQLIRMPDEGPDETPTQYMWVQLTSPCTPNESSD